MEFDSKNLLKSILLQLNDEKDLIANLSNISSMIYHSIEQLNWVGFYLVKDDFLVLGPFQGKPACIRIKKGMGVCGESWQQKSIMIIDDCHNHKNHIACDINSKSEIVIPIITNNEVKMLLDVDSPLISRFRDQMVVDILTKIGILIEEFIISNK